MRVLLGGCAAEPPPSPWPFAGGAAGYFGYDLVRRIERLPPLSEVRVPLPDMALGLFDWALVCDREQRRVRDADGVTGWVHASLLDGRRNVVVTGRVNTAILREPKADAAAIAYAAPGLVAKLVACAGEWCEVSSRGYDGFVTRDRLFGVYEHETIR